MDIAGHATTLHIQTQGVNTPSRLDVFRLGSLGR